MFPGEELLQEGIAAFQAGDRAKAHELLSEVVKVDPENEQAWYYLAASESDPALRRQFLEQVLEINPGNAKAREVLERIKAREGDSGEVEAMPAPRPASGTRLRPIDPAMNVPGAASDEAGSFKIPFRIPGAPERTTWELLARDGVLLLRTGFDVVLRKPGIYEEEVARATWWRFWLIAGASAVGSAILSIFNALFLQVRFSSSLLRIFAVLLTPFFFVAIALITLFIACYVSHRWARSQGGNGSLLSHAYTVALVFAPVSLLNGVLSFAFNLFGIPTAPFTLLISLWALIVIADGFERLHVFTDPNQKWITAIIMLLVQFVATLILGLLLSSLIVRGALPFAL